MSNDTIFREVDEELRSDRMRTLWRRFGPYIIGAAVAVVLLVAVNEGWRWWQNTTAARASDQYYAALELAESGDVAGARAALSEVVAEGAGGYPTLARFREAGLLASQGDTAAALAAYDALATGQTNPRLRELALVLAGYLLVDSGDVAQVQQRVGGLAVDGNPMRNAAREAIGLAQFQAGDLDAALFTFESILTDPVLSQDMASRIQIYVAQLVSRGAGAGTASAAAAAEGEAIPLDAPSVGEPSELDLIAPDADTELPVEAEAVDAEPTDAPAAGS